MSVMSSTLRSLQQSWHRLWHDEATDLLLLDDTELAAIHALARHNTLPQASAFETRSALQGDMPGTVYGSGIDFDGLRDYQNNDELRAINWRAYARTRELHVNIYKEERRPGVFIVMDRRTGMRFGTRHAIKARIAAAIAGFYALSAISSRKRVAAVCLNQSPEWYPYKQGLGPTRQILNAIIAPCPPLQQQTDEPSLNTLLTQLPCYLSKGDDIVIVSDFHDIDQSSASAIYKLTRQHSLYAFHILDPAELHLPDQGAYMIQSMHGNNGMTLELSSGATKAKLNSLMQQQHDAIHSILMQSSAQYRKVISQDDILQLVTVLT